MAWFAIAQSAVPVGAGVLAPGRWTSAPAAGRRCLVVAAAGRWLARLGFGVALGVTGGCASIDDRCIAMLGDSSLTPAIAARAPDRIGQWLTWGGMLVEARPGSRETELEVVALPLDCRGQPRLGQSALGRFLVLVPGQAPPIDPRPGRLVTATGRLGPPPTERSGHADAPLPRLVQPELTWWPTVARMPDSPPPAWPFWPHVGIGFGGGFGGSNSAYGGLGVHF